MSEAVPNTNAFSTDLFSPLQFCEVVDDGLQHLVHLKNSNTPPPITVSSCNNELSNIPIHQHKPNSDIQKAEIHINQLNRKIGNDIKQSEALHSVSNQQHCGSGSFGKAEMILPATQTELVELGNINSQHQPMYASSIRKSDSNPITSEIFGQIVEVAGQNFSHSVVSTMSAIEHVTGSMIQSSMPMRVTTHENTLNNVANIGVQTDEIYNDEPQVLFTSSKTNEGHPALNNPSTYQSINVPETIAPKKTWRRPWKKKKEREKKTLPRKTRRVKRRRLAAPRKSAVHIDPKNGPPVDTTANIVERKSEDNIDQLKQKRQRIKLNRNSGREYVNRLGKIVVARKIGQPCNCPLKCWDRMGTKVLEIFNNFWDLCDFNLQNSYLFTCLKLCDVKRRYTKRQPAEESRRQNTFEYFVRICGKHAKVCKKAFMSSHGLTSDKRLRTLFCQMKDGALIPELDRRGKHFRPSKSSPTKSNTCSNFRKKDPPLQAQEPNKSGCSKPRNKSVKRKSPNTRLETYHKAPMFAQAHSVGHLDPSGSTSVAVNGGPIQEPPHTYIPNGEIYFPAHYLEPPQLNHPHMNPLPSCQKMLEGPAYFMAGMKENTFHQ